MKKRWVIILLAMVVVVVVVGVIALVVADRKFALRGSPPFSHEPLVTPGTRVQIAVWPGRGEDTVVSLLETLPEERRPSGWVVRRILPQEVAVLMAPDRQGGVIHVTGFVNEQRLGPVIRDAVNSANLSKSVPVVQWAREGMLFEKRGMLTLHGEVPIDARTLELTENTWTQPAPDEPLALEGGHAIEAVLDNRDGGAFAILSALELLKGADDINNPAFFVLMTTNIASIRLSGDFTAPNELAVTLKLQCRPDVEEDVPSSLKFVLDMGVNQGKGALEQQGATFQGGSRIEESPEGMVLIGEYTIGGIDEVVAAQLAPPSDEPESRGGAARLN